MINVLIICSGNSCRSIIGEALLNHLGSDRFKTCSAGSYPTGLVNPDAISILKAHDIATDGLSSKSWDALEDIKIDTVTHLNYPLRRISVGEVAKSNLMQFHPRLAATCEQVGNGCQPGPNKAMQGHLMHLVQ